MTPRHPSPLVECAVDILTANRGEDTVVMDVRHVSTVTDYFVISTCQNEIQMKALLDRIHRAVKPLMREGPLSDYVPGVKWGVLDCGDVMIHLFEKKQRERYSLERLWSGAAITRLPSGNASPPMDEHRDLHEYL